MTVEFLPFPPAARSLLRIRYGVVVLLGGVVAGGAAFLLGRAAGFVVGVVAWVVAGGGAVAFALWWSTLEWTRRTWRLSDSTVELRQGVIWKSHAVLPRNRVQNVTLASGPIRRYFGVETVTVHSAGAATPNIVLEGFGAADAARLRELLMPSGLPGPAVDPAPPAGPYPGSGPTWPAPGRT